MKKITTLILVLTMLVFTANAQKIGIMAGGTFSKMVEENTTTSFTPGFNGSIMFQKSLFPMLALRPSLGYYQKGTAGEVVNIEYLSKINYLQLNMQLRIKPPLIPIYAVAGPYVSYALSGYNKVGGISSDIDFGKGKTLPYDFGLSFGAGYQMNLMIGKVFFEGGLAKGLLDIDDSSSATSTTNMMIYANVGLLLGM